MFDAIATVLAWFYELIPNYAVAIALLTLTVMILLTPLTLKSTKSMLQLQRLQPEMKRIQAEYKHDRQKLNEELMKFYQAHKINPLGGCLPILLQLPVFFVLYRVISKLTLKDENGLFVPSYLDRDSALYRALHGSDEMASFGIDLARSASKAVSDSFVEGIPYLVLILIVAGTSYYQQRQIAARNKNGTAINPQQQMLLRIMPAFFAIISLTLPAAIVVYFLVSNLYRIGQQAYITRALYKHDPLPIETTATEAPRTPKQDKAERAKAEREGRSATGRTSGGRQSGERPARPSRARDGSRSSERPSRPRRGGDANAKDRPRPGGAPSRPTSGRVTPPGTEGRRKKK